MREQWGNTPYAFRFTYLTTGELNAITVDEGVAWASFGYDDLGRRTGLSYINGRSTSYAYGADLRLSGLTHHMAAGPGQGTQNDVSYGGYSYNPAGQITSRTASNDSYAYAPVPTAITYGIDALNQLEGSATAPGFYYDARGNNTFIGSTSGIARGYDADSKIVNASVPSQQPDILAYDALDRLASIRVGTGGPVTQLVWDGDEVAAEADASGNVLGIYAHGQGTNEPVLWYQPTVGLQVFHADERGSIVALSDKAGTVERIHAYDAYGREGAAAHLGRFGYTGAIALPESGLVHMRARAYDPNLGRFVSADPIGVAGGINLYAYAGGDPINGVDPSGTQSQWNCTGSLFPECPAWVTQYGGETDGNGTPGHYTDASAGGGEGGGLAGNGTIGYINPSQGTIFDPNSDAAKEFNAETASLTGISYDVSGGPNAAFRNIPTDSEGFDVVGTFYFGSNDGPRNISLSGPYREIKITTFTVNLVVADNNPFSPGIVSPIGGIFINEVNIPIVSGVPQVRYMRISPFSNSILVRPTAITPDETMVKFGARR